MNQLSNNRFMVTVLYIITENRHLIGRSPHEFNLMNLVMSVIIELCNDTI